MGSSVSRAPKVAVVHDSHSEANGRATRGGSTGEISRPPAVAVAEDAHVQVTAHSKRLMKTLCPEAQHSVVVSLTDLQLDEFREAFNAFDLDGSGSIDNVELGELFRSLGQEPTSVELEKMVTAADVDGNGSIDFLEFSALMAHMMATHDDPDTQRATLRHAFGIFDVDGNGTIDADEIRRVMLNLGEPVSRNDVDDILELFDKDGNGNVDYDEFSEGILGHKLLKPITVQPTTEKGLQESTARAIRGVQLRGEAGSSPGPLRRALTTQNL